MTQNEERLTESNSNINTVSELPGRKFSITMELPLFLTMLGLSLSGATVGNIILYRTCVHSLNKSEDVCKVFLSPEKSTDTSALEKEVQKYTTLVLTVKMLLESIIPAFLSLFLGVWSDTHGRKPLVVWPLLGLSLNMMLTVVFSMLDNLGPWWIIATVIPFSLSGGFTVLFTGAFCYLSDITSTESRSLRMIVLESAVSAGSFFGSISSSYLLKYIGHVYLLCVVSAFIVFAYAFANICLTESLTGALKGSLSSIFDFLLVKEMLRECFKKRPNNLRAQILLITFANSLSIFILYGLISLEYLYVRQKIHWSMQQYTIFSASSTLISFAGSFAGVAIFQKLFKASDLFLAALAFLSAGVESVIRALATTTWHMYLGTSVSLLRGLSSPLLRSFLTKAVPMEDVAKVFVLMSAVEAFCPLASPVIYNSLYAYTISSFPAGIYVLTGGINILCVVLLMFVFYYRWSGSSASYQSLQVDAS